MDLWLFSFLSNLRRLSIRTNKLICKRAYGKENPICSDSAFYYWSVVTAFTLKVEEKILLK
jgi:hypothetical protein